MNKTNKESSQELEPNDQALAPSMANAETKELDKNSTAIDGCQQHSCSASGFMHRVKRWIRNWLEIEHTVEIDDGRYMVIERYDPIRNQIKWATESPWTLEREYLASLKHGNDCDGQSNNPNPTRPLSNFHGAVSNL